MRKNILILHNVHNLLDKLQINQTGILITITLTIVINHSIQHLVALCQKLTFKIGVIKVEMIAALIQHVSSVAANNVAGPAI